MGILRSSKEFLDQSLWNMHSNIMLCNLKASRSQIIVTMTHSNTFLYNVDPTWTLMCVRNEQTYQDAAIWPCGHVIDHNLFEWRASFRNTSKLIYCHLTREENMLILWNVNNSLQGPIKWNHTSGTKLDHIPWGNVFYVAAHMCYVMESAHGKRLGQGWLNKPNPPLSHSCFLLSVFIRSELWLNRVQRVYGPEQDETRGN